MRRIQELRKKSGLEKSDEVSLFVKVSEDLKEMLLPWEKAIKEKVGASAIKISDQNPARQHANTSKESIKDEEVEIFFDVMK